LYRDKKVVGVFVPAFFRAPLGKEVLLVINTPTKTTNET
jgi:hypothetical protein